MNTDLPLVLLDASQSKFWWLSPAARLLVARVFGKKYGESLIVTFDLLVVGRAHQNGTLEVFRPPYYRTEMWRIANKPEVVACKCADFYDPEVEGPWRLRGTTRHHPFCFYEKPAPVLFKQFERPLPLYPIQEKRDPDVEKRIVEHTKEVTREIEADTKKQRPDAWVRARDELEGTNVIRSR